MAAKAQTIDEGFTIEAPDSVAEGDTVTVRYTIKTQQLESYISPLFDGFEFIDMNYDIWRVHFQRGVEVPQWL